VTPEELLRLTAAGETLDVEFKGELARPLSDGEIVDAVVCLCNRAGTEPGWLLVGVEDDGTITGARPRHSTGTDPRRVQALVAGRTVPATSVRIEVVSVGGLEVLGIEVPASPSPVGTTDGRYVRRARKSDGKPACLPMHFHEMQALQADRGRLDYSAFPVADAVWEDLDPLEFDRYRRFIRESWGASDSALADLPDLELAKALGAVQANHSFRQVRILGLLLFGREDSLRRLLPAHEVAFQVLSGQRVETNDFFRWPLLRVMDELLARFRAKNREDELLIGMQRIGLPLISPAAFREGVANALIHRDYTFLGTVHVQWHLDRLEVSSPGGFPEGVRLDNLLVTQPRPRNPLLADTFKRAGLVERTARGIDTIFFEQLRAGRPAPHYGRTSESGVVLVMPLADADLSFARLVAEEGQSGGALALDDLLLLRRLRSDPRVTLDEAAALIQKSQPEAAARLERLGGRGLVERAPGERTWELSALARRRLGARSDGVT